MELAQRHCIRALHALKIAIDASDIAAVYHGLVDAIDEMDIAEREIYKATDAALPEPIPSLDEFVAAHSRSAMAAAR